MRSLLSSTDSCRNPVNSRNSVGINFGTVACQIDKTIPAECGMEFTFCRNGSGNHREGMALEWEEQNRRCPNRASAFADTRFGCRQPINSFFLNHYHHHRWRPSTTTSSPPSSHRHCHVVITITIGHHPHPSPITTTMRMTWQHHVTQWMTTGHEYMTESKVPRRWQQRGKRQTTTMLSFVISILSKSPLPPLTLLLTTEPGATSSLLTMWQPIMGSTTTTMMRWPHSNTMTQPPPAWHDGNTTMARMPRWRPWMTNTTMQMDDDDDGQQRWKTGNTTRSNRRRLFGEQGPSSPFYFSDTHSSCHITDGDVWQLDDERRMCHRSSSFFILPYIHYTVLSLYFL